MEFLFYFFFFAVVIIIVAFINLFSLKDQIVRLRIQLTEVQEVLLSLKEQLYQQNSSAELEENSDEKEDIEHDNTNSQFEYSNSNTTEETADIAVQIEPPTEISLPCAANNNHLNDGLLQLNEQNEPALLQENMQLDSVTVEQPDSQYQEFSQEEELPTLASESLAIETPEQEKINLDEAALQTADPFNPQYRPVTNTGPNPLFIFFNWLIKGNVIAKIAIVILFLGLTYLFKYSIEHDYISPEIRILGTLVLGFVLLGIGWKLRHKREIYALILQGGAFAILYLTIFAAYRLYELVPMLITFAILLIICSTSILFSILQRAMSLAIIACIGGYVTPILLSNGSGNHIALFSYYLMISSAILVVSIWQSWRILNLLGFLFTFVISLLWGMSNFRPGFYIECQIFIIANMLIYGILAVLFSVRSFNKEHNQNAIDLILLFGTPLSGFALQYSITNQWEFGPAFSSLAFGLFYIIGSYFILRLLKSSAKKISLYGLAIGLSFSTLAIPLAFSANWTATIWLFEGTALSWIMLSQKHYRTALLGVAITLFGIVSACISFEYEQLNPSSLTLLLGIISAILLVNACLWHCYGCRINTNNLLKTMFIAVAVIFWVIWILSSIYLHIDNTTPKVLPILLCFTFSSWLWYIVGKKINWHQLCYSGLTLWLMILLALFKSYAESYYLLNSGIWSVVWIIAFVSAYYYLHIGKALITNSIVNRSFKINKQNTYRLFDMLHISLFWMILYWITRESTHLLNQLPWGYEVIKWSVTATIASSIILLFYILIKRQIMTTISLIKSYWMIGLLPIVIYLGFYLIIGLGMSGQIIYWNYVPIINPLEESAIFALMMFSVWLKLAINHLQLNSRIMNLASFKIPLPNMVLVPLIVLTFFWGNSIVLRCLSQMFDISWTANSLWHNNIVQMTASLLWMLTAVILVTIGHRYSLRKIWYSGEFIQVIVIIKLIFVDIRELDGLLRAFAFIGVALLMLLIGYLAPLPPKLKNGDTDE
ncbi:MAG: DUF2339 domain-containing protein [Gilliamella sp.]|uniref:DUF2339 domain-containing protein n=1 Tax=Gilliamella sp. TaxID=1891236 RepID=UPI0025FC18C8|nr:DUF2339 domain-containing protein [Gilliamella sp.]MCO6537054.1 DUF2339 domain-containing protein [Gilliamella sp.]